jgi:hypothetical protein
LNPHETAIFGRSRVELCGFSRVLLARRD